MSAVPSHGDVRTYRVITCAFIGRATACGLLLCFGRVAHALYVVDTYRHCNLPMAVEAAPTHAGSEARNELLAVAGCLFIQWQCAAALQGAWRPCISQANSLSAVVFSWALSWAPQNNWVMQFQRGFALFRPVPVCALLTGMRCNTVITLLTKGAAHWHVLHTGMSWITAALLQGCCEEQTAKSPLQMLGPRCYL